MDLSRADLGILGALVAVIGSGIYIYSIVRGSTRPARVSWVVWLIIGFLGAASVTAGQGGPAAYVPWVYFGCEIIVVALSLTKKYGKQGGEWYDYPLGALGILAILIWQLAHLPAAFAATAALLADSVAGWVTLRESWRQPQTESLPAWSLGVVDTSLALASSAKFSYAAIAFPVSGLIYNSLVTAVLLIKHFQKRGKGTVSTSLPKPFA